MSVTMTLSDDIDISRGDMIVRENNSPEIKQDLEIILTWMNEKSLTQNRKVIVKHTTREIKAIVGEIMYEIDINTLHRNKEVNELKLNSIGRVKLRTANPLFCDSYTKNRNTGSLIIIDPQTFETVGAGMII